MKSEFLCAGEFSYSLAITPSTQPPGAFQFKIASRWLGAKDPAAEQVKADMTLNAASLIKMADIIKSAVMASPASAAVNELP